MSANITDSDIACSSACCDILKDANGQITGSHLARVARLFAEHREKAGHVDVRLRTACMDLLGGSRVEVPENGFGGPSDAMVEADAALRAAFEKTHADDLERQEKIVCILYRFNEAQQDNKAKAGSYRQLSQPNSPWRSIYTEAVSESLDKILSLFGQPRIEIQ